MSYRPGVWRIRPCRRHLCSLPRRPSRSYRFCSSRQGGLPWLPSRPYPMGSLQAAIPLGLEAASEGHDVTHIAQEAKGVAGCAPAEKRSLVLPALQQSYFPRAPLPTWKGWSVWVTLPGSPERPTYSWITPVLCSSEIVKTSSHSVSCCSEGRRGLAFRPLLQMEEAQSAGGSGPWLPSTSWEARAEGDALVGLVPLHNRPSPCEQAPLT